MGSYSNDNVLVLPRSPVSVGNWAISREFFFEIGGLDTNMQLWGGENIDLSIRVRTGFTETHKGVERERVFKEYLM